MRSAFALIALCTSTQIAVGQDVPFPDFKTRIDYLDWYRKQVVGDLRPADNAAESYAACCNFGADAARSNTAGFKLRLNGMRSGDQKMPPGGPAPWNPEDHPDWEQSYEQTQGALKSAAAAAKLKYIWYDQPPDGKLPEPATLQEILVPHLACVRGIAKGLSEQAWRAPGGKVDAAALLAACATSLRMTQQLDREPLTIPRLVALAVRALVYEDLCAALKHDVFNSPALRARVLEMLAASDAPIPRFRSVLAGEKAAAYDVCQALQSGTRTLAQVLDPSDKKGAPPIKLDPQRTAAVVRDAVADVEKMLDEPYSPERTRRLNERFTQIKRDDELAGFLMPALERATTLSLRAVAARRGTRLAYYVYAYRDKTGKWPEKLTDLDAKLVKDLGTDPFSNQLYVYRVENGQPLLYSVAEDANDDGGKHDDAWAAKVPGGDFVFLGPR